MNQPTEERFKRIEEEQKRPREEQEAIKRRLEQATEPMKAVRVEVASEDVIRRLDRLKQELHTASHAWLDTLQEHYTEHKEAISEVKTIQGGHAKFFEEHGKRLAATASKDDITSVKSDISRLEATMATKDDIRRIEAAQEQILKLLRQKPGE